MQHEHAQGSAAIGQAESDLVASGAAEMRPWQQALGLAQQLEAVEGDPAMRRVDPFERSRPMLLRKKRD